MAAQAAAIGPPEDDTTTVPPGPAPAQARVSAAAARFANSGKDSGTSPASPAIRALQRPGERGLEARRIHGVGHPAEGGDDRTVVELVSPGVDRGPHRPPGCLRHRLRRLALAAHLAVQHRVGDHATPASHRPRARDCSHPVSESTS